MIYEQGSFVEQAKLMLLFHLERRGEQFNVKGTKLSQWSQSIHMIKMISLVMMLILISLVHGNNVQCFVKMPTTINQDTALLAFASLGRRGIYTTIYTNIYQYIPIYTNAEEAKHFHDFDDDRLDQNREND